MQIPIQPTIAQAQADIPVPLVVSSYPGECEYIYVWLITPDQTIVAGTAVSCPSGFAKSPQPLRDGTESEAGGSGSAAGSSSTSSPDGTMYAVWPDLMIAERGHYNFQVVGYTADNTVADTVWGDWFEVRAEGVAVSDLDEYQEWLLGALRDTGNFGL